ncbi:MAG: MMPL family transporter [Thermomicrobiales bacterium]
MEVDDMAWNNMRTGNGTPAGITGRMARWSAGHPWKIIAVWAAVLIIGLATVGIAGNRFTAEDEIRTDLEAMTAVDLIAERLNNGVEDPAQEFVIVSSADATVDEPAFQTVVEGVVAEIEAHGALVSDVTTYYESGEESLVSFDRHRTVVVASLAGDPALAIDDALPVVETIRELEEPAPGFEVLNLGDVSVTDTITTTGEEGIFKGESIGMVIALIVMAVVFGTLIAAGLPILLTFVAILVTMGLAMATSFLTSINEAAATMIFMIGLAVGVDYALFILSRYREEREHGLDVIDAITRAGETSTKAVLFSGMTVVVSLMGMMIVPWNVLTSLGTGAILVVVVSVLMTLTLLPAVVGLLGDRIDRGKVPFIGYQRATNDRMSTASSGFWNWISKTVMRRPVVSLTASAGLLIFLGAFAFSLSMGYGSLSILPEDSKTVEAYNVFQSEFPGADYQPATIVIEAPDVTTAEVGKAVDNLVASIANDSAFGAVTYETSGNNDLMRIDVALTADGESNQAIDAVERLRSEYIPAEFDAIEADAHVTGDTAFIIDITGLVRTYLPIIFAFVLSISFVLLLMAFRSIVIPVKAMIMNLLSVFASYGLLVLVFQHGVGADLFGVRQVERIDAFVPMVLFTIVFGLSMDYHVFMLSRIKEHFDITGDNEQSVAAGLRSTGRLITGAALIMVGVFGGFAAADLTAMQQFGFGLAVAVILDATIVRMVLVPASMALLGERNWYLPSWLAWLPEIHIEGNPTPATPAPLAEEEPGLAPSPAIAD